MEPKQWAPLSDDFKPPILLFRRAQLEEMLKFATHPLPSNMWGQGDRGLGKTVTSRFYSAEIEARGIGKCYRFEWEHKLINVLRAVKNRYGFKTPTYTLSISAITGEIINQTNQNDLICIIIDEPQKAHSFQDVDSTLFDFYQNLLGQRKFCILVISQLPYSSLGKYFNQDTLSRLQFKPIVFANYDVPQIVEILKQRLHYMLEENQYELDSLITLARHIRRIGGDIREALDILRVAIEQATDKITVEIMLNAIEWGKQRWWKSELYSLPPHWAFILYLIAKLCAEHEKTTQSDALNMYMDESKRLEFDALGRRNVYYIFDSLAEKGFITLEQIGIGRFRHTNLSMDKSDMQHIAKAGKEMEWALLLVHEEHEGRDRV